MESTSPLSGEAVVVSLKKGKKKKRRPTAISGPATSTGPSTSSTSKSSSDKTTMEKDKISAIPTDPPPLLSKELPKENIAIIPKDPPPLLSKELPISSSPPRVDRHPHEDSGIPDGGASSPSSVPGKVSKTQKHSKIGSTASKFKNVVSTGLKNMLHRDRGMDSSDSKDSHKVSEEQPEHTHDQFKSKLRNLFSSVVSISPTSNAGSEICAAVSAHQLNTSKMMDSIDGSFTRIGSISQTVSYNLRVTEEEMTTMHEHVSRLCRSNFVTSCSSLRRQSSEFSPHKNVH